MIFRCYETNFSFSQTPRAPLHCLLAVAAVLLHTMGSDRGAHCRHVLDAGTNHTQLLLRTTKGPKWLDQVNQPKLQENPTHQYTTVLSLGKEWSRDMLPRHNYICEGAGKIYRTVFEQAKYTELFFSISCFTLLLNLTWKPFSKL